jgi:hypothetical protein
MSLEGWMACLRRSIVVELEAWLAWWRLECGRGILCLAMDPTMIFAPKGHWQDRLQFCCTASYSYVSAICS